MTLKPNFKPISHSWVATHPEPKGIVQFVGGAFFGTFFPMFFYQFFLRSLYQEGYTLILLPFKFTFNHYREAFFLLREQYRIIPELVKQAGDERSVYLDATNYFWCGHSIGCKYISLLEGFGALPQDEAQRAEFIRAAIVADDKPHTEKEIQTAIAQIDALIASLRGEIAEADRQLKLHLSEKGDAAASDSYKSIAAVKSDKDSDEEPEDFGGIFIKNQISLLIAPDNSPTSAAIKPAFFADFIDSIGLGVKPSPVQTQALIQKGDLFNFMGLVCFAADDIAGATCTWFIKNLKKPPADRREELAGGHLTPLGWQAGDYIQNPFQNPFKKSWLETTAERDKSFETPALNLLQRVREFQQENL